MTTTTTDHEQEEGAITARKAARFGVVGSSGQRRRLSSLPSSIIIIGIAGSISLFLCALNLCRLTHHHHQNEILLLSDVESSAKEEIVKEDEPLVVVDVGEEADEVHQRPVVVQRQEEDARNNRFPKWVVQEAEEYVKASEFCHECPMMMMAGEDADAVSSADAVVVTCQQHIDLLLQQEQHYNSSRRELEEELGQKEPSCMKRGIVKRYRDEAEWLSSLPSSPSSLLTTTTKGGVGLDEKMTNQLLVLPRVLAIYFPQFHPDPLNNRLWGENFTDWNSLQTSPQRNKERYRIPRPSELGYYDLRNTMVRKRQGDLARAYGIDGFLIHHYWFYDTTTQNGPNLHAPLMELLKDGEPNIPFCFNWCAVLWNNVWNGKPLFQKKKKNTTTTTTENNNNNNNNNPNDDDDTILVLQRQYYNATDDMIKQHYEWLRPFFHHPNYMKVDGRPVFVLYMWIKDAIVPILERLSDLAKQDGFDGGLYLILGRSAVHPDLTNIDPNTLEPKHLARQMKRKTHPREKFERYMGTVFDKFLAYPYPLQWMKDPMSVPSWCTPTTTTTATTDGSSSNTFAGQQDHHQRKYHHHHIEEIPGIIATFDNTPRRDFNNAVLWNPAPPKEVLKRFQTSLDAALYYESCCHSFNDYYYNSSSSITKQQQQKESRFIIINAWNEWAEGMSLEPSDVYGRGFLEIIRETKRRVAAEQCNRHT